MGKTDEIYPYENIGTNFYSILVKTVIQVKCMRSLDFNNCILIHEVPYFTKGLKYGPFSGNYILKILIKFQVFAKVPLCVHKFKLGFV